MTPVTNEMIERIIVPVAKMAKGTWATQRVSMNSSITTQPDSSEMRNRIAETVEKNTIGLYSLKIAKIVRNTEMPSRMVLSLE